MDGPSRSSSRLSSRAPSRASTRAAAPPPASSSNIRVVARFRPHTGASCVRQWTPASVDIDGVQQTFALDHVFGPQSTQEEVFDTAVRPTVEGVLQGYNGCVLAYGQTGAGKSHTMMGPEPGAAATVGATGAPSAASAAGGDSHGGDSRGAIPRMVEYLFASRDPEHRIKVAHFEIYNEKVRDLIGDPAQSNLRVHETNGGGGFYVKGLEEVEVSTAQEVYAVMRRGARNRSVAATHMNASSSRSHSIFLVDVSGPATHSKLLLVDLAGSEKVAKTGARGQLLEEASNINRSLSSLGMVVNALASNSTTASADLAHVPFRDSKLTRILQDSLAGNSRTCLIVHCSPALEHASETVSTLRFGTRAKAVKTLPHINAVAAATGTDPAGIEAYRQLNIALQTEHTRLAALCRRAELNRARKDAQIADLERAVSGYEACADEQELRVLSEVWALHARVASATRLSM